MPKRRRSKFSIKSYVYNDKGRRRVFDGPWRASFTEALEGYLAKLEKEGLSSGYQVFVAVQVEENMGEQDVRGQWYTMAGVGQELLIDTCETDPRLRAGIRLHPLPAPPRKTPVKIGEETLGFEMRDGAVVDGHTIRHLVFDIPGVKIHRILNLLVNQKVWPALVTIGEQEVMCIPGDTVQTIQERIKAQGSA